MPAHKYFITGTDTDCGKTLVACALLRAAARAGYSTIGMKPVAAGATPGPDGLRNDDALRLQRAATLALPYEQVNPVCLSEAVSPHLAAAQAGTRIQVQRLAGFCQGVLMKRADLTLIEGAGGWRVPLNDREFLSDLPKGLQLPVILVVGLRLGCLNHALLSAEAIVRDGLQLAAWVST
ncbi:MAG TPA: dethiobiotin synthase, partial [Pseudomonadaceae bacterium]|nr:dethiobiotin synthase [Pseudomonadaceae bacterium]